MNSTDPVQMTKSNFVGELAILVFFYIYAKKDFSEGDTLKLQKFDGGTETTVASADVSILSDTWYDGKIVASGNSIKC